MINLRQELLNEGVLTLDGIRFSDGYAWCELRATNDLAADASLIRLIWASECRKGYGTILLEKIIRAADRVGKSLYLEVKPFDKKADGTGFDFDTLRDGAMTKDQLKAWYHRHGFESLEGDMMVRKAGIDSPSATPTNNAFPWVIPSPTPFGPE